jgi:epoxyqueuosine reductase
MRLCVYHEAHGGYEEPERKLSMSSASLQRQIRDAARRLGFALCGFARIEPLAHADFVRHWLGRGNAASMAYLARGLAKRLDPRLILPQARSVITVGYRYLPPPLPPFDWQAALRGRIAAYALDADYHRVVRRKLDALAAVLAGLRPGALALAYVDTGAILEREWAARGALGWFGKNTNILHTEEGSYFFLGELLTSLELEAEPLVPDHCGTCTRCLDLCPTQALAPGYALDARLCISYLTIEHRGPIPIELRPKLGNWIFGCDVCQEVCPWNEKLVKREPPPDSTPLLPYLPDLLRLDTDGFEALFAGSAIRRAKRDGFVRNVAVALGNSRNPAAVPVLRDALEHDPSVLVRAHVAWALGAIGGGDARRALERASARESDATVRAAVAHALEGRSISVS